VRHHPVGGDCRLEQGIEIEPLGIEQQPIHVEDDAGDGTSEGHDFT
jgi:hypothetical protein